VCCCVSDLLSMEQKVKDNLIYLGVAAAIVAALVFYIFYTDRTMGRIPNIPGSLLWGILSTPSIAALILERFWKYRRRPALWGIVTAAVLINVSAMFVAYSRQWNPPVLAWSIPTGLWMVAVFVIAQKILAGGNTGKTGVR
jgi:hypothetical protein